MLACSTDIRLLMVTVPPRNCLTSCIQQIAVGRSRQGGRGRHAEIRADWSCIHGLYFSLYGLPSNLCRLRFGLKHVDVEREEAVLLSNNAEMQIWASLLLLTLTLAFSTHVTKRPSSRKSFPTDFFHQPSSSSFHFALYVFILRCISHKLDKAWKIAAWYVRILIASTGNPHQSSQIQIYLDLKLLLGS